MFPTFPYHQKFTMLCEWPLLSPCRRSRHHVICCSPTFVKYLSRLSLLSHSKHSIDVTMRMSTCRILNHPPNHFSRVYIYIYIFFFFVVLAILVSHVTIEWYFCPCLFCLVMICPLRSRFQYISIQSLLRTWGRPDAWWFRLSLNPFVTKQRDYWGLEMAIKIISAHKTVYVSLTSWSWSRMMNPVPGIATYYSQ